MVKRLIDANASDFAAMQGRDLVHAIRLSEGRVVVTEVLASAPPLVDKLSNAELAAGMGADLVLLNLYDVNAPRVSGFPSPSVPKTDAGFGASASGEGVTPATVKDWIGRPVGLNLEPIPAPSSSVRPGRLATPENALAAIQQGADFVVLTANPNTGVTTQDIAAALRAIRKTAGEDLVLFAGKMHAAGRPGPVVQPQDLEAYCDSGADGVLLPAPGTVPGMTLEISHQLVEQAHAKGLLVMNAVGTSQEGASVSTIEQLALWSKMSGADLHHLGDAGAFGMAVPENIMAWSIALRGRRHTWHRMAASLRR